MSDQGVISFIEVNTKRLGFHLRFLVSVHRTLRSLFFFFFPFKFTKFPYAL